MLAVILAGLLAIMAPSAFADDANLSLDAALEGAPDKGWYGSGDVVEISALLSNDGDSTSIVVDPSCDEVFDNVIAGWDNLSIRIGKVPK